VTTHPPQPGSLAEAVEARVLAVEHAREAGGDALLTALTSLLTELSEVDDEADLPEPLDGRAEACAVEILDLCEELAAGPGTDLVDLAGTVGATVERYGWIADDTPVSLARRALGLLSRWADSPSSGVVLECGRAAGPNIGLLADEGHGDEAIMHSQRLLLAYERHFTLDPALFVRHVADAHDDHANLLVQAKLKHAAVAHSERAVALMSAADLDEQEILGRFARLMRAHGGRLRAIGDLDGAHAVALRLVAMLPDPSEARARTLAGIRDQLAARGDRTAAIEAGHEAASVWKALPDQEPRVSEALRAIARLQSREKLRDEAVATSMRALAVVEAAHEAGQCGAEPVAETLRQVVTYLLHAGRHGEALAHSEREIAAWRRLFDGMGTRHHEPWANANNSRAVVLNHLGRHTESLDYSACAVALYDLLAAGDDGHRASLANALFTRHATLRDLRDHVAATSCTYRMIKIYDDLAAADPDEHLLRRAEARKVHAGLLSTMGNHRRAMSWSLRALEQFDELVARFPGDYTAEYADALTSRLVVLQSAGEPPRTLLRLSERIVALEDELDAERPGGRTALHSMALTNHAICLATAGRLREAVEVAARGVEVCDPEPATPKDKRRLADCLNTYGVRLDAIGRHEEALECSTRAMAIYDELLALDRHFYLTDAAAVKDNHAAKLAAVGRLDEAIGASWESVAMFAERSAEGLAGNGYAVALANLAHRLKRADRAEEAVEPSAHALRLREELAAKGGPDLRGDLGQSHLNHGHTLALTGDAEGARNHTAEAIAILDELAETDRPSYLPRLAQAVHNLASYQEGAASAESSRRAVELREELVATDRDLYLPDLAASLRYAVKYHDRAGQAAQAETLALHEIQVVTEQGDASALADLERGFANRLMKAGRRTEAVPHVLSAVALARGLVAEDRPEHVLLLRNALSDSAWMLCDGDPQAALVATEESLALSEEFAGGTFYGLAHALDAHASTLAEVGRHDEALELYARALPLWETIAEDGRESAVADVAWCLTFRSISLAATGSAAEALEEATRAVELYTGLPRMRADLAFALQEHARRLFEVGRVDEARSAAAKALAHYESLMEEAPLVHRPYLAKAQLTAAVVGAGDARELGARAVASYGEARASDPGAYALGLLAAEEFLLSLE